MSDEEESAKDDKPEQGMIPRRILVPISMWTEVLELAKAGGMDHKDALVELLDLGLQAQDAGNFRPRTVLVPHLVMERVSLVAKHLNAGLDETITRLVDLGLQSKGEQLKPGQKLLPPGTIPVRIECQGQLLEEVALPDVPAAGEVITVKRVPYVVKHRAWDLGPRSTAFLRVEPYPGRKR